jgi:hypothetical protein
MLVKLTDEYGKTRNNTQWGENVTHIVIGDTSQDLCSNGWIHYYEHPIIAVLLNPIHANIKNPIGWECKVEGIINSKDQTKSGATQLTTISKIELPILTIEYRVAIAIKCALCVYKEKSFKLWANNWLNNTDRSENAANNAAFAAFVAAYAAANNADVAAYAAYAAAYAAANNADVAAYAAYAAANAVAYAAANAAFNLIAICEEYLNELESN